jgi:hypothetical protein
MTSVSQLQVPSSQSSSDPNVSPSTSSSAEFDPSRTVLAPQSTCALAHTTAIVQSVEQLSRQRRDPELVLSSSSSVRTSNSCSSSSSLCPPPLGPTHIEETEITGSGKERRQEETPEEMATLSPPSPILSTVEVKVLPISDNLKPRELLDHLLVGATQVVDVGGLVESARTSFSLIERWYEANSM